MQNIARVRLMRELRGEEWSWCDHVNAPSSAYDGSFVVQVRGMRLCVPRSYPFDPPHMLGVQHVQGPLDAERWCLVHLIDPAGLMRVHATTWRITCTCCNSVACARHWNVGRSVREVADEARFLDLYARLADVAFPVALCDDVLHHLVDVSTR